MKDMKISPKNRNIILIITDGVPDSMLQAKAALKQVREAGIEVYGIGIKTEFLYQVLGDATDDGNYDTKNVVVVRNAEELNTIAVDKLKQIFAVKNLEV